MARLSVRSKKQDLDAAGADRGLVAELKPHRLEQYMASDDQISKPTMPISIQPAHP
jgi:hypothetical protein